jgi:hypothetical protein
MSQIVNKFLAQVPANTLKGNNTGSTANVMDLTVAQIQAMLSIPTSGSPLAIGSGGTGQTTQQAALNALAGAVTSGFYLRGNGTNVTMSAIQAGDVPTLNQSTTGTAANVTATSNSTITTLSALSLPGSQVTGNISGNAANVTGTVAIGNGGTGQTTQQAGFDALSPLGTAGDTLYYNGTHNVALGIGSTGQVLTVVSGEPAWATPATSGTVTSVSVVSANGFAGTVATATSTPAITIETTLNTPVLAGNGTALIAATTTGTGSTVVLSASPIFTGTVTMAALSATTGSFSGAVNMNSNQINNVANGTASGDAVNLSQLQAAIAGLSWEGPVQAYAASNVPLTGGATLTIDGYSVQNGDLVLLGNQTTASQNGEYTASGIGTAYTLTPNGLPTAAGDAWLVLNGTVYADSAFVANAAVPTATFTEFAGPTAYTFTAPLSLSGRTVSITQATTSTNGYLSSTDWNTFNNKQAAGNYITALTGDGTASGPGSAAFTLATVNSNVGSFGGASSVPSFTVNAKGLITAASATAVVAPAGTLSGTTLNSTVVSSSLTSVGTITSGTWTGTTIAIANGGTGQTTAANAFNALAPSTATGGLILGSGTNTYANLPIGTTGYVLTVVGGTAAWAATAATATNGKDTFVLSSGDITNGYVTLSHTPLANSTDLLIQGAGDQLEGASYDYTVSGATIVFQNGLASSGVSALVAGDILQVQYEY